MPFADDRPTEYENYEYSFKLSEMMKVAGYEGRDSKYMWRDANLSERMIAPFMSVYSQEKSFKIDNRHSLN